MVAAPLARGEPEAAPGVGVARPRSAQVDDRGQVLLLAGVAVTIRRRAIVRATSRSSSAAVISTAWLGSTRV